MHFKGLKLGRQLSKLPITLHEYKPILSSDKSISYLPSKKIRETTSLEFLERPSKISSQEKLGIPKGERHNIPKSEVPLEESWIDNIPAFENQVNYRHIDRLSLALAKETETSILLKLYADSLPKRKLEILKNTDTKSKPKKVDLLTEKLYNKVLDDYDHWLILKEIFKLKSSKNSVEAEILFKKEHPLKDILPKELIDTPLDINFDGNPKALRNYDNYKSEILRIRDNLNFFLKNKHLNLVLDFRNYYAKLGISTKNLSDYDILKIINDLYLLLRKNQTGDARGTIFSHGSNKIFDLFDYTHTGDYTDNIGAIGVGNYFATSYENRYGTNVQPFLINDVIGILEGSKDGYFKGVRQLRETNPEKLKSLLNLPEQSILELDEAGMSHKPLSFRNGNALINSKDRTFGHALLPVGEVMIRRNSGIKSLFPHPDAIMSEDGKIIIKRNWADPRLNFKNGGSLNYLKFINTKI